MLKEMGKLCKWRPWMEKTPPPTGHPSQRDLRSGQLQLKARSVGSAHSTTDTILFGLGKINCMSFKQRMASELYFVTSKTAFTIPYLELCYYRLLRAKTSPGQEAAVRHLVHSESLAMFWQHHSFRDHLLHAVEGYALARRTPDEVIPFNLDYPAKHVVKVKNPLLLFHPVKPVCEPRRTVAQKGRPMKLLPEHERSCHCKKKDAVRQVLPDRTAGWQLAMDPKTGKVLGAYEHIINDRNEDKVALLQKVLAMPNMNVDVLVHDDACHFEQYVDKTKSDGFDHIRFYLVDTFHMKNHKCSKSVRTRKEKTRLKDVKTSNLRNLQLMAPPNELLPEQLEAPEPQILDKGSLPLLQQHLAFPASHHHPALHGPVPIEKQEVM